VTEAFFAILIFVVGCLVGYIGLKRSHGERKWREGYLYGFNLAWDEHAKLDKELRDRHLKEIRRKRPSFKLIRGNKDVHRS